MCGQLNGQETATPLDSQALFMWNLRSSNPQENSPWKFGAMWQVYAHTLFVMNVYHYSHVHHEMQAVSIIAVLIMTCYVRISSKSTTTSDPGIPYVAINLYTIIYIINVF